MLIGEGVSYISYSIVSYFHLSCSGLITSVGEERAIFLLSFTCNYVVSVSEGFSLPLGVWDRLLYFIAALPGPSM